MKDEISPRDRVLRALQHKEPDRIPFDLGGNPNAGIHINAFRKLQGLINIHEEVLVGEEITQQALLTEDILRKLEVDTRRIDPSASDFRSIKKTRDNNYISFYDDYGIKWVKPVNGGLYYDPRGFPLADNFTLGEIKKLPMPGLPDAIEIAELKKKAERIRENGFPVIVSEPTGGFFELACMLRGTSDLLMDMVTVPSLVESLLDKLLDYRLEYWEIMLEGLGGWVDIVTEADDIATQNSLMFSPDVFKKMFLPRYKNLCTHIKKKASNSVYICFHSCGAIRDIIPHYIEAGIDAINPVQVSAFGMDTKALKKDFGDAISFWGGGVDTQYVLPRGSIPEIREEVKKRIDDLSPGGGFIFAPVHNIQPDVPPENIVEMIKTLRDYGCVK